VKKDPSHACTFRLRAGDLAEVGARSYRAGVTVSSYIRAAVEQRLAYERALDLTLRMGRHESQDRAPPPAELPGR